MKHLKATYEITTSLSEERMAVSPGFAFKAKNKASGFDLINMAVCMFQEWVEDHGYALVEPDGVHDTADAVPYDHIARVHVKLTYISRDEFDELEDDV